MHLQIPESIPEIGDLRNVVEFTKTQMKKSPNGNSRNTYEEAAFTHVHFEFHFDSQVHLLDACIYRPVILKHHSDAFIGCVATQLVKTFIHAATGAAVIHSWKPQGNGKYIRPKPLGEGTPEF